MQRPDVYNFASRAWRDPRCCGSDHEQGIHPGRRRPGRRRSRSCAPPLPAGTRNYMTPGGFARLSAELERLVKKERPELVAIVSWAASNGDRSENGDYIYGKKRLREIDRRMRFLLKRLDVAEVVDPLVRARRRQRRPGVFRRHGHRRRPRTATSAPSASSASTRSTPRAATSAGSRRWRARCSSRARATR